MRVLLKGPVLRVLLCAALAGVAGCGDDDFKNDSRPPTALELTGVIQNRAVSIQPGRAGAGPFEITITNQTDEARAVVLEGTGVETRVGAIQPRDTATIQKTLPPGEYRVRVEASEGRTTGIKPATLMVGEARADSGRDVLLP